MPINTGPYEYCERPAPNPLTHMPCRLQRGHGQRDCLHWEYPLDGCTTQLTCGTCRFQVHGACTNASSRAFGMKEKDLVTCSLHERHRHLANPQPRRRMVNRSVIAFLGMTPPSQLMVLRHSAFMYVDDCGCRNDDGNAVDHNGHHRAALLRAHGDGATEEEKAGFH